MRFHTNFDLHHLINKYLFYPYYLINNCQHCQFQLLIMGLLFINRVEGNAISQSANLNEESMMSNMKWNSHLRLLREPIIELKFPLTFK
jgi:hypothetical protein